MAASHFCAGVLVLSGLSDDGSDMASVSLDTVSLPIALTLRISQQPVSSPYWPTEGWIVD